MSFTKSVVALLLCTGGLSYAADDSGEAQRSYAKICNSGAMAGQGTCPASPVLGGGANDWGCSLDRDSGLIWEVKTEQGLRSQEHTYTWLGHNGNGEVMGMEGHGKSCANTLNGKPCNTTNYVTAINQAGLCGARDWRLPSREELEELVDYDQSNPAIAPDYFPNTPSLAVWSGSADPYVAGFAWLVHFTSGYSFSYNTENELRIRLVRAARENQ